MIDLAHVAGKYGAYVWPAYGVSLLGLVGMTVETMLREHRWRREADRHRQNLSAGEPDEV